MHRRSWLVAAALAALGSLAGCGSSGSSTPAPAAQTITFPAIPSFDWSGGSATLTATASSGLAVTYAVQSGPCALSGATLTATAAGSCVVTANQAGNASWAAAAQQTQSVTITAPLPAVNAYSATAAAGDFITITVDRGAQTIAWVNATTLGSGTASYTVGADGALLVADPAAEITKAYEIPGVALVAKDKKAKDGTRSSPVFAWQKTPATKSQFKNMAANMFQFRNTGAFEIGCGAISLTGDSISHSLWMPEGAILPTPDVFSLALNWTIAATLPAGAGFSGVLLNDRPDGTIEFKGYKNGVQDGNPGTLFKAGQSWAIDVDNGPLFILDQAAGPAWDPARAGTYHVIGWKVTGLGLLLPGTPGFFEANVAVNAAGTFSWSDLAGTAMGSASLAPFNNDTELHGPGKVDLPCNGLFTFGTLGAAAGKSVIGFVGQTLFLGMVKADGSSPSTQEFIYGVGLKAP